jgi:hypothetical protein
MKYKDLIQEEIERLDRNAKKLQEAAIAAVGNEADDWKKVIGKLRAAADDLYFLKRRCSDTRLNTTVV